MSDETVDALVQALKDALLKIEALELRVRELEAMTPRTP